MNQMISEGTSKNSGSVSGFTADGGESSETHRDASIPEEGRSKPNGELSTLESSELFQGDLPGDHKPEPSGDLYMSGMSEQGDKSGDDDDYDEEEEGEEEEEEEEAEDQEPFHLVTLTLTIGFSIPDTEKQERVSGEKRKPKATVAASKAVTYYHIDYTLLPDDPGPTEADVAMSGAVARLFIENNEPQALKPWFDSDKIWLSWSHVVELKVTKTFLMKALSHVITVNICENKGKHSSKSKIDKAKTFKLPVQEVESLEGEIQNLVTNHRKLFEDSRPKPSFVSSRNANVHHSKGAEPRLLSGKAEISEKLISGSGFYSLSSSPVKRDDISPMSPYSLGVSPFPRQKSPHEEHLASEGRNKVSNIKENVSAQEKMQNLKAACESLGLSPVEREGRVTLQLDFMPLFAGDKSVTQWIEEPSFNFVNAFMTLAIDAPLVSEEQKLELNPLIIRIMSATSLPITPISVQLLKEKCVPVYCKYRCLDLPPHQTNGQKPGTHVYFKDVYVILAETISPGLLYEYLRGPPIEIEVHDRDRKIEDSTGKVSLFGTEPEDEKLSNVGFVASKNTVHDPFTKRENLWDPYGIAKVDLSALLQGKKSLNITVPIHNCIIPVVTGNDPDKKSEKIMGVMPLVDGPQDSPLPMGRYLESGAKLKIRVDITVPLTSELEAVECPFGRMIYIFEDNNTPLLHDLMNEITEINAIAIQLDSYPLHLIQKALYAVKLEDEQKESSDLDIITGFHIMDGQIHLFVLEGLKDKAIKRICKKLSAWNEDPNVKILYNSNLSFHQRLYKDLDAILYHIQLYEPLSCIMKQPLLYVRDMVPHACFQALSRLDYICYAEKLRNIIHEDLLPSAEMITLLSREFGIPLTTEKLFAQEVLSPDQYPFSSQGQENNLQSVKVQLGNSNESYVQLKKNKRSHKDHIQINIDKIFQMSKKIKKPQINTIVALPDDGKPVHRYGFQSLNSAELAKKLLRKQMAKEPRRRFAYNNYLSGTVDPVDLETELKECAAKSKSAWLTPQGFVYPGVKSRTESNQHPRKPLESRVLDLSKKWKENILHTDLLKPMFFRGGWGWDKRHVDFDLYSKPPNFFSEIPDSTYLTEDLSEEFQKAVQREYIEWLEKIVVDDPRMKFYRCSIQGELTAKGPKASSQQKKLGGLLKDKPAKFSLRHSISALKPIPSLAVLERSEDTTKAFGPGLFNHRSLLWHGNTIPRYDMEHKKFEQLKGADFKLY